MGRVGPSGVSNTIRLLPSHAGKGHGSYFTDSLRPSIPWKRTRESTLIDTAVDRPLPRYDRRW